MKNKRLLTFIISLVCCPLVGCNIGPIIMVSNSTYTDKNGYKYEISGWNDSRRATLTDVKEGTESIVVPDDIKGVPITSVSFRTADHLINVTELILGNNVEQFDNYRMNGGYSSSDGEYQNITYESPWRSLEVFSSENSSITTIQNFCFYDSPRLAEIRLNEGLLTINDGAFYGCGSLRNFKMPNSVEVIGDEAFKNCKYLNTKLRLSNNIKDLGSAFAGTQIIDSYKDSDKDEITLLTNGGKRCLIHKVFGYDDDDDLTLSYDVIGARACIKDRNSYYPYNSISLNVRSCSHNAFYSNTRLTTNYLNIYVDCINEYAFSGIEAQHLYISGNVQEIVNSAFNSYSLKTVELKDYGSSKYVSYQNALYEKKEDGYELFLVPGEMENDVFRLHEKTMGISSGTYTHNKIFERIEVSDFSLSSMFPEKEEDIYYNSQTDFFKRFKENFKTKEYSMLGGSNRFRISNKCLCSGDKLLLAPSVIEESTYITDPSISIIGEDSFYELKDTTSFKFSRNVTEIEKDAFNQVSSPYKEYNNGYYYNYRIEYEEVAFYIPKEVTKIDGSIIKRAGWNETKIVFYVEATSKPEGWNDNWYKEEDYGYSSNTVKSFTVHWGCAFDY